jgi:hypothetical protein
MAAARASAPVVPKDHASPWRDTGGPRCEKLLLRRKSAPAGRQTVTHLCHDGRMASVHLETLRRAAQIVGNRELADALGVSEEALDEWKAREKPVPEEVFLKCVDIVVSDMTRRKPLSG